MLKGKTPLTICLVLLAAVFSTGLSYAQMTRINVGYSAISGDALPAWSPRTPGYLKKTASMFSWSFSPAAPPRSWRWFPPTRRSLNWPGAAVINSVMAGSDAALIAGGVTSLNYYLLSRPEIKSPEQLKGGSVAISRFGSSSDFIARYALSKSRFDSGQRRHDRPDRQHHRARGLPHWQGACRRPWSIRREHHRPEARHDISRPIFPSSVSFTNTPPSRRRRNIFANIPTSSAATSNHKWKPCIGFTRTKKAR